MRLLFHRWQSVLLLSGSSSNVHFHRLQFSRGAQHQPHQHRSFCADITKLASKSSSLNKVLDLDESNVDTAGTNSMNANSSSSPWIPYDSALQTQAQQQLRVWPLDEYNAVLLNEVHPRGYTVSTNSEDTSNKDDFVYDLIALGAGAGGLVASKQSARRGAKSAMISSTWRVEIASMLVRQVAGVFREFKSAQECYYWMVYDSCWFFAVDNLEPLQFHTTVPTLTQYLFQAACPARP
jgi:hypothetical protein